MHDRTGGDEHSSQLNCLLKSAAAVAAKVNDHSVNSLIPQFRQMPSDIAGRRTAGPVRIRGAHEIRVECRQLNDSELQNFSFSFNLDCRLFGHLFFEFNLLSNQCYALGTRAWHCILTQHFQINGRSFWTSNQVDDILKSPTNDIPEFASFAVAYCDNPVSNVQTFAQMCRPASDDALYNRVLPFISQHRTNSLDFLRNADFQVAGTVRREKLRVWVQFFQVRIQE